MLCLRSRYSHFITVIAALWPLAIAAQTPGARITGAVRDPEGAGRAGVRVTAVNQVTATVRTAVTSADGWYTITDVAPGLYMVSASQIGFRRAEKRDVNVTATGAERVDFIFERLPLQAITVTATLREEQLADIPFSIAAPSARELRIRGAETIEDVAVNVAGFSVQNLGPGQSQVAMRGTSAGQIARDQPGVKEEVGAYLDDVPMSLSLFTPDVDFFDINRVEVLRGPQGTLFGSGSLTGTVRYITNQPELGVRSVFGEVGASALDNGTPGANIKLGVNFPLGERAATRIAAYHNQLGGWMDAVQPDFSVDDNVNTGQRSGVRAAIRFDPSGHFSITPRVVFQRVKMDGWNRIDAYNILANPYTTTRPAVTLGERELFTQLAEPFTDDFLLGDLRLRYDFSNSSLVSITSFNSRDILVVRDATALTASITGGGGDPESVYTLNAPLDDATDVRGFTQEVRLSGGAAGVNRLRWLVGGFYSDTKRDYGQSLIVAGYQDATGTPTQGLRAAKDELFFSDLSYSLQQFALFGEGTWAFTNKIDLTAGLRYYNFTEDRDQVFDGIFAHGGTGTTVLSVPGSVDADGLAPRFIVTYKASNTLTWNAQASKGFRLGGINDPLNAPLCTPTDLATFSGRDAWTDETAWNYELGMKYQFLGGSGSLNASAFYMDIRDLQLTVTAGSCSSRLVFNVPKARSQGLEFELAVAPSERLDFAVSTSLTDSELRSTLTSTDSLGQVSVVSGIEEGNRLPSVPQVQGTAAATYRWPRPGGSSIFVSGSYHYVGTRYTQIDDLAAGFGTVNLNSFAPHSIGGPFTQPTFTFDPEMPAYSLVNLRVGMRRPTWDLSVYLNNLTDERAFLALDRERGTRARVGYLTNPPRTLGVTLGFQR